MAIFSAAKIHFTSVVRAVGYLETMPSFVLLTSLYLVSSNYLPVALWWYVTEVLYKPAVVYMLVWAPRSYTFHTVFHPLMNIVRCTGSVLSALVAVAAVVIVFLSTFAFYMIVAAPDEFRTLVQSVQEDGVAESMAHWIGRPASTSFSMHSDLLASLNFEIPLEMTSFQYILSFCVFLPAVQVAIVVGEHLHVARLVVWAAAHTPGQSKTSLLAESRQMCEAAGIDRAALHNPLTLLRMPTGQSTWVDNSACLPPAGALLVAAPGPRVTFRIVVRESAVAIFIRMLLQVLFFPVQYMVPLVLSLKSRYPSSVPLLEKVVDPYLSSVDAIMLVHYIVLKLVFSVQLCSTVGSYFYVEPPEAADGATQDTGPEAAAAAAE